MSDVFISYARADRALAEPIKARLEALGLDVFFDIDGGIEPGEAFPVRIGDAVTEAKAVLALWTPHALTREWCRRECHLAEQLGKLVPATLASMGAGDLREFTATSYENIADLDAQERHIGWSQILFAIAKLMDRWVEANPTCVDANDIIVRAARVRAEAIATRPAGGVSAAGMTGAAAVWLKVDKDDVTALTNFADTFPGTTEAFDARQRASLLKARGADEQALRERWSRGDKDVPDAVAAFLERWPEHPKAEDYRKWRLELLDAQERTRNEAEQKARERDEAHAKREKDSRLKREEAEKADRDRQEALYRRIRGNLMLFYPVVVPIVLMIIIMTMGAALFTGNWAENPEERRTINTIVWASFVGSVVLAIAVLCSIGIWYTEFVQGLAYGDAAPLSLVIFLALSVASYWVGALATGATFTGKRGLRP